MEIRIDEERIERLLKKGEELAGETKKAIEELLETLDNFESRVVKIVKDNKLDDDSFLEKFDYAGYGLRYIESNIGGFIGFVKLGTRKILPSNVGEIGAHIYLHGDIHAPYDCMTLDELIELATISEEWLENFNRVLTTENLIAFSASL